MRQDWETGVSDIEQPAGDEGDLEGRKFYRAEQEAGFAESAPNDTPQTRHPAYRLAFRDTEFLLRDEARVGSMLVMYGSARIPPPEAVETALAGAKDLPVEERLVIERLAEKAKYYAEAYKLARL